MDGTANISTNIVATPNDVGPRPDWGAAIFDFLVASTNAHAARVRAMTPEQLREMQRVEMRQIREWGKRR